MENPEFWQALDALIARSRIVIDRPRGSAHPCYPEDIYPLDYGYLEGTASMDGGGIDVWQGSRGQDLAGLICTVDLCKGDSEIKLLLGCTPGEMEIVYKIHNQSVNMKGLLIRREGR